jgi:hypothetical protein
MASSSGSATIDHGVLVRQWKWPLRVVWWWFIIGLSVWFGAITVHWYWARDRAPPEERVEYARTVLRNELGHLAALRPGIFDPVPLATWINNTIHDGAVDVSLMFARSLMNWPSFMRRNASSDIIRNDPDPGGEFVLRQIREAGDGWHLAVANTGLFAVRTATYLCALPLLGVGVLLGATDGLVARAKSKHLSPGQARHQLRCDPGVRRLPWDATGRAACASDLPSRPGARGTRALAVRVLQKVPLTCSLVCCAALTACAVWKQERH